jgi:3-oxoacyl-[acyl-carrier protein] reductase
MRLGGKVAVVTGAGSGIGSAVCQAFDREGAKLVAVDIDGNAASRTASQLSDAIDLTVDVSDSGAVDEMMLAATHHYGRLDIVAHIAGIDDPVAKARIGQRLADDLSLDVTANLSNEQWHRIIAIDLTGAFFVTRSALRAMLPQRSGSIVHMSSIAGVHGHPGLPHYSAAKAGLIGLTRSVAKEIRDQGVRVNAVAPSGVDTPMISRSPARMAQSGAAGRLATAAEVAQVVLFLASDESSYITGEVVNVNGGRLTVLGPYGAWRGTLKIEETECQFQ